MINYTAIQDDLKTILEAGTYTDVPKEIFIEGMEREMLLGNMPFINIRLVSAVLEIRSLPNGYYGVVLFKIDVVSFNLKSFQEAAITRDRLLRETQLVIQSNRQFSAGVETSRVGPGVEFSVGIAESGEGQFQGHVASATTDVIVEVFIEPA